jgi:hypothetical protein
VAAELRAINNLFFGMLDASSFSALSAAAAALVQGSDRAVHYLHAVESEPVGARHASPHHQPRQRA